VSDYKSLGPVVQHRHNPSKLLEKNYCKRTTQFTLLAPVEHVWGITLISGQGVAKGPLSQKVQGSVKLI
jgi:hypothetical protein